VLARGELDATPWQRVAAVFYATGSWVAASLVLGLISLGLLRWRAGRILGLTLSSVTLGLLALLLVLGTALRILSGSYLTVGAILFSLASHQHFLHGVVGGYGALAAGIAGTLLVFILAFALWLAPASRRKKDLAARHGITLGVLLVMLVSVYALRPHSRFARGVFLGAPLLALVSSFDMGGDFELDRLHAQPDAIAEPLAPHGPPLSDGTLWRSKLTTSTGPRPNVLLIMLESVTPAHMSMYGYERPTTPEIDRLARGGIWFKRAWTTATHSNYAQMAALSSLFPRRVHGLDQYTRLDYPRMLYHDVFHLLGYQTATISSQDETWQGMRRFQNTGTPTHYWHSEDFTGEHFDSGVEKSVPDHKTVDVVLDWLASTDERPWALYVNFQATHFPYNIPLDAERPYQPDMPTWSTFGYLGYPESERDAVVNRYDNALKYVDAQVGRLRKYLKRAGELQNTIWVISSDHGEMFYDRDMVTHGRTLYDVEARVPLVLHWPEGIRSPELRSEPASHLDIMPTVLDFLGLPSHPSWQGRSLRRAAAGGNHPIYMNIQGLRFADALICWPFKLILERTSEKQYLYDLAADPKEEHNLIEAKSDVAQRLNSTLSKQLIAQLDYHREDALDLRKKRYQPRLRACP